MRLQKNLRFFTIVSKVIKYVLSRFHKCFMHFYVHCRGFQGVPRSLDEFRKHYMVLKNSQEFSVAF